MRIFFVHTGNESFVKLDRELLYQSFEVLDFHAAHKFPLSFMEYLRGLRQCDVLFCWFASNSTNLGPVSFSGSAAVFKYN